MQYKRLCVVYWIMAEVGGGRERWLTAFWTSRPIGRGESVIRGEERAWKLF
jgi:hypothetical protein